MRRRVRLTSSPGEVVAELEDHAHAMRCRLRHADGRITDVEPEFVRFPLNTCPGAQRPLAELIGTPIDAGTQDFFAGGRARRNCTHMLDLAWLASRHAARDEPVRDYVIAIPDAPDGRCHANLERDGAVILRWQLEGDRIVGPPPFDGRDLHQGFVSWVLGTPLLDEDGIEAALVLHKGWFVRAARQFELPVGPLADMEKRATVGACHGYAADTIDLATRRAGQFRDFSAGPERLLRFLD